MLCPDETQGKAIPEILLVGNNFKWQIEKIIIIISRPKNYTGVLYRPFSSGISTFCGMLENNNDKEYE